MIIKQKYLDQLMAFRGKDLIKVVTGVRRCGKSTLLSGRYVEVEMLPLTFSEYLDFQGASPTSRAATGADLLELANGSLATVEGMLKPY